MFGSMFFIVGRMSTLSNSVEGFQAVEIIAVHALALIGLISYSSTWFTWPLNYVSLRSGLITKATLRRYRKKDGEKK